MSLHYTRQFEDLVKSWKLTVVDVPVICRLSSFHEIEREIRQRNDTKQFIYCEMVDSGRDGVADYFGWHYIDENKAVELINKRKNLKL